MKSLSYTRRGAFVGGARVPGGPVQIDWASPITRGLIAALVPGANGANEVVGIYSVPVSPYLLSAASTEGPTGSVVHTIGQWAASPLLSFTTLTMFVRMFIKSTTAAFATYGGIALPASPWGVMLWGSGATSSVNETRLMVNAGGVEVDINLAGVTSGAFHNFYSTWTPPGVVQYAIDTTTVSNGPAEAAPTSAAGATIQVVADGVTRVGMCVYCWNRALTTEELRTLYVTPYIFLKPLRVMQSAYLPPSGGSVGSGLTSSVLLERRTLVA